MIGRILIAFVALIAIPPVIVILFEAGHAVHAHAFESNLSKGMPRAAVAALVERYRLDGSTIVSDSLPIAPGAGCTASSIFVMHYSAGSLASWDRTEQQGCGFSGMAGAMIKKVAR